MFGHTDFNPYDAPFSCNNKLLAARCYVSSFSDNPNIVCGGDGARLPEGSFLSAREENFGATTVAAVAAGNYGVEAIIDGEPQGIISGVAPRARLAVYKVCWGTLGCGLGDIYAAIDDAIADGVDVISFSLFIPGFNEELAEAFLNIEKAGIPVAAAAGDSGPGTLVMSVHC